MNINPFDILKNAQDLQEKISSFQEKLDRISATGSAGGGMVEIDFNGKMEALAVRISPEAADPADIRMLEDLVAAAIASGAERIKDRVKNEMGALTGGMGLPNIPGLFG